MILTSSFPPVDVPDLPLHQVVLHRAAERGNAPAIVDCVTGRALSYADVADGARRCAGGLATLGMGRGDVLAIMLPNLPEFAIAYHGALAAGVTVTTLSPLSSVEEATFALTDTRARFLVTSSAFLDVALAAADKAGVEYLAVLGGHGPGDAGVIAFADLLADPAEPPDVAIDPRTDVAALLYSSGTTGAPKAVQLTHRALVAALLQIEALTPFAIRDTVLCPVPFFHIAGQAAGINKTLGAGATLLTLPRFDLDVFLGAIERHRVSAVVGAPPIVHAFAAHPLVDRHDLSSLERIVSGSAPLSAALQSACAARLGRYVGQAYGLTETGLIIAASPHDRPARPGAAGMLCPSTQARLVDPETGRDVPTGEAGELWVRGPQLMSGYLGRPDATAATIDAEGWLRTGDLVRIDEDGWLFVIDRLKELIKYKGFQVAPVELEGLLIEHPAVADVAVVGRPDADAGEIPVAHVVRRRPVDAAELIAHVAARVSPQHRVRAVEFVDAIPRSPAGKILRRQLALAERAAS